MKKRLVCVLIVLVMVIGLIPGSVFASSVKSDTSRAANYGTFVSGADVINTMIKKYGKNTHPRIIMTADRFAELKKHINDGSTTAVLLGKLQEEADNKIKAHADKPIHFIDEEYKMSLLEQSKEIQRRVAALALAYNIFGNKEYAQTAYEELENAAKFSDWHPYHFLDTAEMCTAFAYGYDWLYNWMNDTQRNLLRKAMIEKGLKQVMEDYQLKTHYPETRSYTWYKDEEGDNWKLVCTGGTNLAALAIGDESDAKEIASDCLTYGFKEAYSFVRRAYKELDGSYKEGLGYWDYATYYLGLNSSSLTSATGTDYGLADYTGVRKSVDFVRGMSTNKPTAFSFGDDRPDRDTGWAVFTWLGAYFKSNAISSIRLKKIASQGFNYLDVLWIDPKDKTDVEYDGPTDFGGIGYSDSSFRNNWKTSGTIAALHTGVNDYFYHGHFDLGSFYVESNGSRFFTDLGNEDYNLEDRRNAYRIRAEGHNTLVINPSSEPEQTDNVECVITGFKSGKEAYALTDLTAAYKASGANSVVRGLKMIKDKKCIIVQDKISLNKAGEIYWFAHTMGNISIASDGRSAVVTVDSNKLWVGLVSEGGKFTQMKAEPFSTTPKVSGQADNSKYRKLAIHLENVKDTTITVACIPLKNGATKPSWIPADKDITENQGHTLTAVAAVAPTCTNEGHSAYYICKDPDCKCGRLYSDAEGKNEIKLNDTVIKALGHDLEHVDEKAATNDEDGWIGHYRCKREGCGKLFADPDAKTELKKEDIIIPRTGAAVLGEEAVFGNFIYKVTNPATDGTGTVTLIGVATDAAGVSIPDIAEIKGYNYIVNRIGPKAFYKNTVIKTLTIGANVKIIDSYAFYGCKSLTKVYGGKTLETIGSYAFAYCLKLKSYTITSAALKKIGTYTFKKDKKLKTIKIKYTTKLTKAGVKKSLKGSKVKTVKVKKSKVKKYKKYFKKSNSGRTVRVKK